MSIYSFPPKLKRYDLDLSVLFLINESLALGQVWIPQLQYHPFYCIFGSPLVGRLSLHFQISSENNFWPTYCTFSISKNPTSQSQSAENLMLRWKTSKGWKSEPLSFYYKNVSHSVFTTKIHWGAFLQISGVFWIWICTQTDILNLNLHSNLEVTYYMFLGVGVRQKMISPQVSELSLNIRAPFHLPLSPCKRASCHTY